MPFTLSRAGIARIPYVSPRFATRQIADPIGTPVVGPATRDMSRLLFDPQAPVRSPVVAFASSELRPNYGDGSANAEQVLITALAERLGWESLDRSHRQYVGGQERVSHFFRGKNGTECSIALGEFMHGVPFICVAQHLPYVLGHPDRLDPKKDVLAPLSTALPGFAPLINKLPGAPSDCHSVRIFYPRDLQERSVARQDWEGWQRTVDGDWYRELNNYPGATAEYEALFPSLEALGFEADTQLLVGKLTSLQLSLKGRVDRNLRATLLRPRQDEWILDLYDWDFEPNARDVLATFHQYYREYRQFPRGWEQWSQFSVRVGDHVYCVLDKDNDGVPKVAGQAVNPLVGRSRDLARRSPFEAGPVPSPHELRVIANFPASLPRQSTPPPLPHFASESPSRTTSSGVSLSEENIAAALGWTVKTDLDSVKAAAIASLVGQTYHDTEGRNFTAFSYEGTAFITQFVAPERHYADGYFDAFLPQLLQIARRFPELDKCEFILRAAAIDLVIERGEISDHIVFSVQIFRRDGQIDLVVKEEGETGPYRHRQLRITEDGEITTLQDVLVES